MDSDDDRKARLAAALRANLKKRKAQSRADVPDQRAPIVAPPAQD